MRTFASAALVTVCVATTPPALSAPLGPFSALLVFGDSISDPGNVFVATGGTVPDPVLYPEGQFTDGDTWATQLGADLASGTNFAFGGASAVTDADARPDFAAQRALYAVSSPALGSRPLTAVNLGGNDLRVASTPAEGAAVIADATSAIANGVEDLIESGLRDFLIFGLPDLGRLPNVAGTPAAGLATGLTLAYNAALQAAFAPLEARANLIYFDTFEVLGDVFADPGAYGITNTSDACLDSYPLCGPSTAEGYVFYDDLHPTETVHAIFAERIAERMAPIPLPGSLPLAVGALVLLAGARYRSRHSQGVAEPRPGVANRLDAYGLAVLHDP